MFIWGAVFLVSQAVILALLMPLGLLTFLQLQISFSRDFYWATFEAWRAKGVLALYRLHLYPDLAHPLWYGCFLISIMASFLKKEAAPGKFSWMFAFPVIAAVSDEIENLFQFIFLSGDFHSTVTAGRVFITSLASLVKWTSVALSLGWVAFLASRRK